MNFSTSNCVALVRRSVALLLLTTLPLSAMAAQSAAQVIEQTTDALLADLQVNKAQYKEDPAAFYAAMDRILGPVVDLEGLSKGVMTVKYSRRASPEQMTRFEQNFKTSLMRFYGNALLEYDNQQINIVPGSGRQEAERESVNMEIKDGKGTIYPLSYTMVLLNGQWRMRNVTINGINIGKLFRDQFSEAMRNNRNNLNVVIDTWADTVSKAKESQQAGT